MSPMHAKYKRLIQSQTYQIAMLVLCIYTLATLAIQVAMQLDTQVQLVLGYADYAVCVLFLIDFFTSLWLAENRWKYMASWGWIDVLSYVPTLRAGQWGSAAL